MHTAFAVVCQQTVLASPGIPARSVVQPPTAARFGTSQLAVATAIEWNMSAAIIYRRDAGQALARKFGDDDARDRASTALPQASVIGS